MAFTFDPALADNVSLVRFHIGDVNEDGFYLHDETIQYFVTAGSVGSAVIACIKHIITQLSVPNFNLDWMSVSVGEARQGYEKLLKDKQIEFGIQTAIASASISLPHRIDSYDVADENGEFDDPGDP